MKIGFAARWDPEDKKSWSGISHYTWQQIKKNHEVDIFHYQWPWYLREWCTTQKSINRRWWGKHTSVEFLTAYAKYFSRQLQKDLKKRPVDVLFVSASPQLIAYLKTDIPVVFMIDTTFEKLQGYYPYFSNLAAYNIKQGIALDKKAFQNAAHCMLTSDWAKTSAMQGYGIPGNKISVVLCGANLDKIPEKASMVQRDTCSILFLGVEWERKGGGVALDTFRLLQQQFPGATLHIVGCTPPIDLSQEKNITVIPFLDKNDPGDFQRLQTIFQRTDFLLLPTRAECAGIVFCEASAYGIPSITTNTGGVSDYVRDGINGYALPPDAPPQEYANVITNILNSHGTLQQLKQSSRTLYDTALNWDQWGNAFEQIIQSLV